MMTKLLLLWILILSFWEATAKPQKPLYATKVYPLCDSTVDRFNDLFQFAPLYQDHYNLAKYVDHVLRAKTWKAQEKNLRRILHTKTPAALCIVAFDYYFQHQAPVKGSNVERFLSILNEHPMYEYINTLYKYEIDSKAHLKDSVWKKIGWQFGYGSFYFLSDQDARYMAAMQKRSTTKIDEQVISIINHYLEEQTPMYHYHAAAMVNDIGKIAGIVHVIHDGCLIKTMQLPNWDQILIEYIDGKDTIERAYTIQIGYERSLLLFNKFKVHVKQRQEIFFKKVAYVLHGYQQVKEQCEKNEQENQRIQREYNEYLKSKKN